MKFLIVARASAEPGGGVLPRDKLAEAMLDFDEALANAKVPVAAEGLHLGYAGARTCAGFWITGVFSEQEAVSWALRIPRAAGGEDIEIRQVQPRRSVEHLHGHCFQRVHAPQNPHKPGSSATFPARSPLECS